MIVYCTNARCGHYVGRVPDNGLVRIRPLGRMALADPSATLMVCPECRTIHEVRCPKNVDSTSGGGVDSAA